MKGLLFLVFIAASAWAQEPAVKFRFPIAAESRKLMLRSPVYGFDNDPTNRVDVFCRSYQNRRFPSCYDGHTGTDFMLSGGFRTMDKGSAHVVAAEAGIVTQVVDGNYDRCHLAVWRFRVVCNGHPMEPNFVEITHSDGTRTRYLHLKKGSIIVQVGQNVDCGQKLALIGSSGWSTAPHLHFAVIDHTGVYRDPFQGPGSQDYSFWKVQKAQDGLPGGECEQ